LSEKTRRKRGKKRKDKTRDKTFVLNACRAGGEGDNLPQILIGASSSRRFGWARKMSLDARHSCRISASDSWTCFPGLALRTSSSLSMMSSRVVLSIPASPPPPLAPGWRLVLRPFPPLDALRVPPLNYNESVSPIVFTNRKNQYEEEEEPEAAEEAE